MAFTLLPQFKGGGTLVGAIKKFSGNFYEKNMNEVK